MTTYLNLNTVEALQSDTTCYQLEDGTILYYQSAQRRLFIKDEDGDIAAPLPAGEVPGHFCVQGNVLFFSTTARKIYKAVVTPFDTICVNFVRDFPDSEVVESEGICSVIRYAKKYYCQMSENPLEGILGNDSGLKLEGAVKAIQRRKLIYILKGELEESQIRNLNGNSIMIFLPRNVDIRKVRVFTSELSSLIYVSVEHYLFTFNTKEMEVLPALEFDKHIFIVGVIGGLITMVAREEGSLSLVRAQAPKGYFEAVEDKKKKMAMAEPEGHFPERKFTKKAFMGSDIVGDAIFKRDREVENENIASLRINETVNELLDKNASLTEEIAKIQQKSQQSLIAIEQTYQESIIRNLLQNKKQLEDENKEFEMNLQRTTALNEELEAANQELETTKEEMTQRMKALENNKKLERACAENLELNHEKDRIKKLNVEMKLSTSEICDENAVLKRRLEKIMKRNAELSGALCEKSGNAIEMKDDIEKILADNEGTKP